MPPPADAPIGWSPNAQATTQAAIANGVAQLTQTEMDNFLFGAQSLVTRSLLLTNVQARTLNTVPITIVPALGPGLVFQPLYWILQFANGAVAYSATILVTLRYVGSAVDLGGSHTIANSANVANRLQDSCGNQNLGNGVLVGNTAIQARAVADRSNGSGFVLITVAGFVLPELP